MLILAFSYVDRMVFAIAQQQIASDLHLSDTQLGVLSGLAFALFYSLFGIPLARWADRGDRIMIVVLTTVIWSISVALSGFVGSFSQLLLIRIGIAAGEAGCGPPANSLIPEYFSRAQRPRAVAYYMLGVPLGPMVGNFAGGWLNELYGWRATFVIVGLPGLVLAALAAFTLREPRRGSQLMAKRESSVENPPEIVPLTAVLAMLWASRTFRHLLSFFLVSFFCGWAMAQWQATFFIRSHGVRTAEIGMWLALAYGGGGLLGTWVGGEWASRYASQNESLQLKAAAGLFFFFTSCNAVVLLHSDIHIVVAALTLGAVASAAATGPLFATVQTLVPARIRATAQALVGLLPSFIGLGLGPLAAGALSDVFRPWAGEESLRYALVVLCPGYCLAGWSLWRASKTVAGDLALVAQRDEDAGRHSGGEADDTNLLSEIQSRSQPKKLRVARIVKAAVSGRRDG